MRADLDARYAEKLANELGNTVLEPYGRGVIGRRLASLVRQMVSEASIASGNYASCPEHGTLGTIAALTDVGHAAALVGHTAALAVEDQ